MRTLLLATIALGLGTGAAAQDKPKAEDDAGPIAIETVKLDRPADWKIDVHPILKTACLACHNTKDREGELVLETPADMIKGGESGPAIVPGKGAESLLIKSAARLKKPHMPPKKNKVEAKPLTPRELGLLKLWIDQGAKGTITPTLDAPVWQPTAPSWTPIYAAALDAEGQTVACGRAGRLYLYSVATGRVLAQPSDPKLNGFAHRDAVQAIAFSPDGATLATGGYRSIKIWKRESLEKRIALDQTGEVKLATLSADGKRLAVATAEPIVITVYDLATGKASPEMKGHSDAVTSLRFSPDGASLASGSLDKTARIWTIADGKETAKFAAPAAVNAVEWTVNGKQLAVASADPLLRLWNAGEPAAAAKELKGHAGPVTAVALTPAGLLSASQDGKAILWTLETGAQAKTVTHGAPVTAIAASADGKRWLTLGGPTAKLWNAETAAAVATLSTDGPAKRRDRDAAQLLQFATNEVTFRTNAVKTAETHKKAEEDEVKKAADAIPPVEKDVKDKEEALAKAKAAREAAEKELAAAAAAIEAGKAKLDAAVKAIAAAEPEAAAALARAQADKTAADAALAAVPAPDKAPAAAAAKAAAEAKAKLDAAVKAAADAKAKPPGDSDEEKKKAEEAVKKAEADRAAAEAAFQKADKARLAAEALLAEATKKQSDAKAKADAAAAALPAAKAAGEKSRAALEAARAAADQGVKTAETQQKGAQPKIDAAKKAEETAKLASEISKANLESAKGRAEKAKAEVVLADKGIVDANQALEKQKQDQGRLDAARKAAADAAAKAQVAIRSAAFSADGAIVALGAEDGRVYTYGAEKGADGLALDPHGRAVFATGLSADGALVSLAADGTVRIRRVAPEWKLARTIEPADPAKPPADRVLSLAFSPDGKTLASGGGVPSRDGEILLWDVAEGKLAREMAGVHSDSVFDISWSPDGSLLASAGGDKFARISDPKTGKVVRNFEGHTNHVLAVAWNRTGRTIATAGADDVVKVWDATTGQQTRTIQGFAKQATKLRYVAFDAQFVVAAGGVPVRLVAEAGNVARNYESGKEFMYTVALSGDGQTLAAGSLDGVLRLWSTATGASIAILPAPN